jgi:hypothetical protein
MDLRRPAGWLFLILAVILIAMGLFSDARARLTEVNVNLWSGIPILVFSAVLLMLGYRRHA